MRSPWPSIAAGRVARIEIGGTPARNNPAFWARGDAGHPWVSIADMREAIVCETNERITDLGARNSNVKSVPAGTPLMSFKLTVGRVAVAGTDLFTNEAIAAFHVDASQVSPRWLVHVLPSSASKVITDTAVKGATLNKAKLHEMPLDLPPLPEQRRIAEILDTLGEAIRKTEQVIAKLQQMKRGLVHDLLTRGIDEHGELRDPERHPEQFKNSPLGRIPRSWEAVQLGEAVPFAQYGISVSLSDRGEIAVLRMMNFAEGEADLTDLKFCDRAAIGGLLLQPGDVLFNRTNSIDHVGRTGIWRGQIPEVSFASYLVRLVPSAERLRSEFLNRWLGWEVTQIRIRRWATPGVSQVNINPTNLRRTLIALPSSLHEQDAISSMLMQHDEYARDVRAELEKLSALKHGLMGDLLTGRVRVTVPSEATA